MSLPFESLDVYSKAVDFADRVYCITKDFPKDERFGVIQQFRTAALSISQNIAEGSGRYSKKDFVHFLRMARSSGYECAPLLEISTRQGYIDRKVRADLYGSVCELVRMINGLIKSLQPPEKPSTG